MPNYGNYIGKRVRIKTIEELEAAGYCLDDNGSYTNGGTSPDIIDCMVPLCGTIAECVLYDCTDGTYLVKTTEPDGRWNCWYYGEDAFIALEDDDDATT